MERYDAESGSLEAYTFGTEEKVMTFRPTMEEFQDFQKYVEYMETKGAHKAGIAKVVPPPEWKARAGGYKGIEHLKITSPVEQLLIGSGGAYTLCNVEKKEMTLENYLNLSQTKRYETPVFASSYDDLERNYWKNLHCFHPLYGADVPGSLYDESQNTWNIATLPSILKCIYEEHGIQIQGVNTPYLYFGMWKTTFPWHTEDADLYSINYLHFGAPKFWYVVPPEHGLRLERVAQGYFQSLYKQCHAFLRHKTTVLSPTLLHNYSIPYNKVLQCPGEFIVTFPYAYHSGFNTGFNCAESTNFALPRWIDYGKYCSTCECMPDAVKIDMDVFVRKYQPEKYEAWRAGGEKSAHPEGAAAGQSHVRVSSSATSLPPPLLDGPVTKPVKTVRSRRQGRARGKPAVASKDAASEAEEECSSKKRRMVAADKNCQDDSEKLKNNHPRADSPDDRGSPKSDNVPPSSASAPSSSFSSPAQTSTDNQPQNSSSDQQVKSNSLSSLYDAVKSENNSVPSKFVVFRTVHPTFHEDVEADEKSLSSVLAKPVATVSVPGNALLQSGVVSFSQGSMPQCRIIPSSFKIPLSPTRLANMKRAPPSATGISLIPVGRDALKFQEIKPLPTNVAKPCQCGRCNNCSLDKLSNTLLTDWRLEDVGTLGPLGATLSPLWIWRPSCFSAERAFNHFMSSRAPHCAICQHFVPDSPSVHGPAPPRSMPVLPELAFALRTTSRVRHIDTLPEESMLLHCSDCSISVHAFCYGAFEPPTACSSPPPWRCDRCAFGSKDSHCSLCVLRGGALKPTKSGKWAHIICALCSQGSSFECDRNRGPIVEPDNLVEDATLRTDKPGQANVRCLICRRPDGAFTHCSVGCRSVSHATCSSYSGMLLVVDGWPNPVSMVCLLRHLTRRNTILTCSSAPCPDVGDPILLISTATPSHSNAESKRSTASVCGVGERLLPGVVIARSETIRLQVRFEDSATSCDDVDPSDVVDPPISNGLMPQPKTWINVRWTTDNKETIVVRALCRGVTRHFTLDLQLRDGTQIKKVAPGHVVPFFLSLYDPLYFTTLKR